MSEDPASTAQKLIFIPYIEEENNSDGILEVVALPSERQAKLVLRALRNKGWPGRRLGINYVAYFPNADAWEASEGSEWRFS